MQESPGHSGQGNWNGRLLPQQYPWLLCLQRVSDSVRDFDRDCHQSVINTLILGDIEPAYIYPQIDNKTNILMGIKIEDAIDTIDKNLDAKAILLTYPTYYGKYMI